MTENTPEISFDDILKSHQRIKDHIKKTPLINNFQINKELGNKIFFKMENLQKTNSFKARGAFNAILSYFEKNKKFPEKIVVQSSGNHAQAIAYACKKFGIPALIYMVKNASRLKIKASEALGAEVILCDKRSEANRLASEKQKEGYFFIHPANGNYVISGQGTAVLEALQKIKNNGENIDAIFAPCGGGGLVSGSFLAAKGFSDQIKVFACEPKNANDAAISVARGEVFSFEESPDTIADGARTLGVSSQIFFYLKQLAGILEISEEEIIFWQKKLSEILQEKIEPTSSLAMAGLVKFLKENPQVKNKNFLVIISGGNC